jgi:hypothetical protein
LKNPSEAAKPFLNTGNKLNEAIAALTEMSEMNHTSNKGGDTMSGRRTTTKEPIQKRTTSPQTNINPRFDPQMPGILRLAHHRGTRGLSSTVSLNSFNRIQAMVPLTAPLFGVIFLRGHISLKNWTYCPVLRDSTSPFKGTCLLITLKQAKNALYGLTVLWHVPFPTL